MSNILVPISPGELLDKITILRIKSERMSDATKLENVRHELGLLEQTWREAAQGGVDIKAEERALLAVNTKLWDIEDDIRAKESEQAFDREFIELARAVYISNDERAALKKRINQKLGSKIVEEKSYKDYRR
jgi:Lhr-like helicase